MPEPKREPRKVKPATIEEYKRLRQGVPSTSVPRSPEAQDLLAKAASAARERRVQYELQKAQLEKHAASSDLVSPLVERLRRVPAAKLRRELEQVAREVRLMAEAKNKAGEGVQEKLFGELETASELLGKQYNYFQQAYEERNDFLRANQLNPRKLNDLSEGEKRVLLELKALASLMRESSSKRNVLQQLLPPERRRDLMQLKGDFRTRTRQL